MAAYYNEFDKKAAAWLRELIKAGHIADGEVDERSIEDVVPRELTGYTQCHFFAGIGVWSYALRQAGWPDDRPVWTGSCPCQPFSAAGKGGGFDDERHLWPAFHHLISQCRPSVVFGEQVASKDGLAWLDLVQADLEGTGYAVGAVDTCAAGFGSPHIRQRLYWVADAQSSHGGLSIRREESGENNTQFERRGSVDGVADTEGAGEQRELGNPASTRSQGHESIQKYGQLGSTCFLDYTVSAGLERLTRNERDGDEPGRHQQDETRSITKASSTSRPGPVNGFWGDADWLSCRDNKWRSVESGTFPLVDGAPARVGRSGDFVTPEYSAQTTEARIARLRGYGNAIVAPVAVAFIQSYLEVVNGKVL